jgi:hypothetical protein
VRTSYLNFSALHCPVLPCTARAAESGLAASCVSSPHLRTNSVHDPPRSVVLLGKRSFDEEAGEPTPASKLRSVRQKTTEGATDLPFLLPQPLFTAGGSSGRHGGYDGGLHSVERDGRGGKGGKGVKKKAKEAPNRNRRKPQHASVKQHQVRGCGNCCGVMTCGDVGRLQAVHAFDSSSHAPTSRIHLSHWGM